MRRVLSVSLVSAAAVATAATAFASPASSPKALRAKIVAAIVAQKSVHWTEVYTSGHRGTLYEGTTTADVGVDSGRELDRFRFTSTRAHITRRGWARSRLVDDTVYVKGDSAWLALNLGLSPAKAAHYAGRWIAIPRGDKRDAWIGRSLTLRSIVRYVPREPVTLTRRTAHRSQFIVLSRPSSRDELWVVAQGMPLPVRFFEGVLNRIGASFSKWNEPVNVIAPPSSIPIATVRGS